MSSTLQRACRRLSVPGDTMVETPDIEITTADSGREAMTSRERSPDPETLARGRGTGHGSARGRAREDPRRVRPGSAFVVSPLSARRDMTPRTTRQLRRRHTPRGPRRLGVMPRGSHACSGGPRVGTPESETSPARLGCSTPRGTETPTQPKENRR